MRLLYTLLIDLKKLSLPDDGKDMKQLELTYTLRVVPNANPAQYPYY